MKVSSMSLNDRRNLFNKISAIRARIAQTSRRIVVPQFIERYERYKADQLTYRKRADVRSLWIFKAKGSNAKYLGLSLRRRADKLTNKIRVDIGYKGLSKLQLKQIHAAKHAAAK